MEIGLLFVASTFLAGVLTFLAPCTLPLVPAYLGFISGVDQVTLHNPATAKESRRKILLNGAAFVLGFSLVFITLGVLAGFAGAALAPYRLWLARLGGVFVIFFGLFMLGFFKLSFFQSNKRIPVPKWLVLGRPSSSLLIGAAFAFGWTPCVGPILGSVLLLAGTSATAIQGGLLLAVFSLGLAVPFILVAFLFSRAATYIGVISRYLKWVSVIGGILLVFLGILLITDSFELLISYGYELLRFINYDRLLKFL